MKPTRMTRKPRVVAQNCGFCDNKVEPNYKDASALERFVTERGKILSRAKTGICSKHQRALTREVKRARHVAFLPFIVRA